MTDPEPQAHWSEVYRTKEPNEVSWFQHTPTVSLQLINRWSDPTDAVVDVGAGASHLIDHLLDAGYKRPSVVDLAEPAIAAVKKRLGSRADQVDWVVDNVRTWRPEHRYDLWHDRAVFHFFTEPSQRREYQQTLRFVLRTGGIAIIATFSTDGPEQCSGLPVARYSVGQLASQFDEGFTLIDQRHQVHITPSGAPQPFTWVVLRRTR